MDIKCNFHPNYISYLYNPNFVREESFRGRIRVLTDGVRESADNFVRRPVAEKSAAGLRGLINKSKQILLPIANYAVNYVNNIRHTHDHKVVFAMVEKELFGENSIDSLTHDLDKLALYILGFPKSFVTKFHRKHSEHHVESGKNPNLRSMLCDNIASSPEFKPEKKLHLREYFNTSEELQNVKGFGTILEKYHYGEDLDFVEIKQKKNVRKAHHKAIISSIIQSIPVVFTGMFS